MSNKIKQFTNEKIAKALEMLQYFAIDGNCGHCGKQEMAQEILDDMKYWDSDFYLFNDESKEDDSQRDYVSVNHCPSCGCSELLCGYNGNEENCSTYKESEEDDERCDKCLTLYGHCSCD